MTKKELIAKMKKIGFDKKILINNEDPFATPFPWESASYQWSGTHSQHRPIFIEILTELVKTEPFSTLITRTIPYLDGREQFKSILQQAIKQAMTILPDQDLERTLIAATSNALIHEEKSQAKAQALRMIQACDDPLVLFTDFIAGNRDSSPEAGITMTAFNNLKRLFAQEK